MPGRDFDDNAELRPLGEASHLPDHELDTDCKDRRRDSRRAHSTANAGSLRNCRACGASIPAGRTKCRFCLTNHVEPLDTDDPTGETEFLHVIHLVVPASSHYAAIAKGTTAASVVPRNDGTITGCDLVADLDEEPAQQLVKRWGGLPAAVQVTAEQGQRLLTTACERTPGMDAGQSHGDCGDHATFLYDEMGHAVESDDRLTAFLEDTGDDLWLVPALVLHRVRSDKDEDDESQCHHGPNQTILTCRECDRDTTHQFQSVEEIPDETWPGQPIWECRVCGANRYGPDPGPT